MRSALLGLLLATGCASGLREAPTPVPPNIPTAPPWTLNAELLTPQNARIEILVERVLGPAPERRALDALAAHASRYGGRPARWRAHVPFEPVALRPDTSYVVVRYVAELLPTFGWAYARKVEGRRVYFILVNQDMHRRWSTYLPEHRLEQQTLIHEYGHLLGLPPADHGYYPKYPSTSGGLHCVNPDCALSKPRLKAFVYNAYRVVVEGKYLDDYCEECRRAIEVGRERWRRPTPKPR